MSDLTASKFMEAMRRLWAVEMARPPMRIIESHSAVTDPRPRRAYPKHKAKSPRHYARMRKKWIKRYGMVSDPCIIQLGDSFFVHPSLLPLIRSKFKEVS